MNRTRAKQRNRRDSDTQASLWQVFRTPIVLAALSLFGLISALVGDDQYDFWSWLALGVLPLIIVWLLWIKPRPGARR
jgi:hypothetical protein